MAASLLVEILTEELPPRSLSALSKAFGSALLDDLRKDGFIAPNSLAACFATPRRLAVSISDVREKSPDKEIQFTGPSVNAPQQAVAGFAKKNGVAVGDLIQIDTPKGKIFAYRTMATGSYLATNLELKVEEALKRLPVAKTMRWGNGEAAFVRPIHGLVMMHGANVIPGHVMGLESGRRTRGHRFMGSSEIALATAAEYESKLLTEGKVIASFEKRKAEIGRQLEAEAKAQHAHLDSYESLLEEVTALVELPSVYVGTFDEKYLDVPQECLILTMRQNQKYFPLFADGGKLRPKFLIVSNMRLADPRHIIGGNERVVRPRLEDARFFYNQDRKLRLEERVPQLAKVVHHNKLGSQLDRTMRIQVLSG